MNNNTDYNPFNYVEINSDETHRIIESTRLASLGEPILKEVVHIGVNSIILKPKK